MARQITDGMAAQESEMAAMPYQNYAANYPYGERAKFPRII